MEVSPIETMQRWLAGEPVWSYAKIIETWPQFEHYMARFHRRFEAAIADGKVDFKSDAKAYLDEIQNLWRLRDEWVRRFGFAIPCQELLNELAVHGHIVEVGAGTGYMTRLMRHRGITVVGSDFEWRGPNGYSFTTGEHDDEQVNGVEAKTMVRRHPDSTVFCSWPSLRLTWFRQALKAMKIGQRLVVIREGACAEETAWQYLDDCFEQTATIDIPVFEHMHDYASVHVKKRNRSR